MVTGERVVPTPHVPGHEFAGRVAAVGTDVTGIAADDRVTAHIASGCGECSYCLDGTPRLCTDIEEVGVTRDGAYAEYVAVQADTVYPLPDGLSFADGASADPVASAAHAVNQSVLAPGDDIVVVGPGPIGLYAVQLARADGANRIVMLGTRDERNRVASEVGADVTVNVREEDVEARVTAAIGPEGADAVVEATGNPEAIPTALAVARKGAAVSVAGIHERPLSELELDPIVRGERDLRGSFLYTGSEFQRSIDRLASGTVTTDPIITHSLPLTAIERAFDLIADREAIKVQLDPTAG